MRAKLRRSELVRINYPYPVQVGQLGNLQRISLGGEVVVDNNIKLKQIFGTEIVVAGYAIDVMIFLPRWFPTCLR